MNSLTEIIDAAVRVGASDIHLSTDRPASCRVNGILYTMDKEKLSQDKISEFVQPFFEVNGVADKFNSLGEADFAYVCNEHRFRVNLFKQKNEYAVVMRLLPTSMPMPEDLGLPEAVVNFTNLKRGLILVTGETGSGKSTTLASLINIINKTQQKHIITIEDPIEFVHHHQKCLINQRELGIDTLSFSNALRASLREDPDVILVGEMRDLETIETALTAAETGHLVFSTLHTNSAPSTIDRVIDVFPQGQQEQIRIQLASVLEGIVCQQLIQRKNGNGRVAAFEVLVSTPATKNLVRSGKSYSLTSEMQIGKALGMQTMDECLETLYKTGQITAEAAVKYAIDSNAMAKRCNF